MTIQQPLRDVRPSPIAGRWYPSSPQQLADSIDNYLRRAEIAPVPGRVIALLAPHAGHRYSGPVAAYSFKAVEGQHFDAVVLIGPSHYPYPAPIISTAHDAYRTPLGTVPVDRALRDALRERVPILDVREDPEHSLEIELPFLQRVLGEFRLVPLALVEQSLALAQQLGRALADLLAGQNVLLVASSDLSHFYPQTTAHRLDQAVLDAVARFDPAGVIQAEEQGMGFACGRGAIATVMIAARLLGADAARVVHYATSGDVTQDYAQVVGYGAAVFYQQT